MWKPCIHSAFSVSYAEVRDQWDLQELLNANRIMNWLDSIQDD